tara:strand:- start:1842 stop:2984 length:1143 start_codon:yes stop_codon:yes gene_type:complete
MKIPLIFNFFVKSNNSKFRKSFFVPLVCIFIGSFVISMTFSIMSGIQYDIINKIKIFKYPNQIRNIDIKNLQVDENYNFGSENLCLIKSISGNKVVKINSFSNIKSFEDKLVKNDFVETANITKSSIPYILIGDDLAKYLNIDVGDTVNICSILDINIVTGAMKNIDMLVGNIFNFNFMNYDSDYIVSNFNITNKIFNNSHINLYLDDNLNDEYKFESNQLHKTNFYLENKELLDAMEIEKTFYMVLGFFIILVSGFMIYTNSVLVFLEKKSQLSILLTMGLKKEYILLLMIFVNLFLSLIFAFLGISLTYLVIHLNDNYFILNYIFLNMPFDVLPMNKSIYLVIITIIIVAFVIIISTLLPYLQYEKNDLNKYIKEILK